MLLAGLSFGPAASAAPGVVALAAVALTDPATLPSGALSAAVTLVFRSARPPTSPSSSPDATTPLVTPRFAG